ncbi:MAG: polyprenyl synthetase family protein [Thermoanaerobacteraceae bacterium]|nr:polyprenyl synthetase family protein [Thermoanaerobacteraceae bacterium]
MFQFIETLRPELEQMDRMMEREYRLRAGHISHFVSLELDEANKYLYPGMLLLAAKMFGASMEQAIPLASVVQFIRMATHVHDYDGKHPQYPVLVGDYLYSHFFLYLSRYNALDKLAPLSAAICQIHEGGIIRKEKIEEGNPSVADYISVAEKEYGILLAEACKIGAQLADAGEKSGETLYAYGRNLGTAWGIICSGFQQVSPGKFLVQARESLQLLPDVPERNLLALAVDGLAGNQENMKKFMVG